MAEEKDKKKIMPMTSQWVQDARVTSGGTSSQSGYTFNKQWTKIDIDPDADYFKSVGVDYTPEKFSYNPDDSDGFFAQMRKYAQKPEFDEERARRIEKVAKVNALGDLMKHLGAFAGGGYAPTTKREENRNVLRAFQELDKMRNLYDERLNRYNDKMEQYAVAGRNEALQRYNAEESRKLNLAIDKANREQRALDRKADIALKKGTTQISESDSEQNGSRSGWQNSPKNMLDKAGGGGSKNGSINLYAGPGDVIPISKSSLEDRTNLKSIFDTAKRYVPNIEYPKGKPIYGIAKDKNGEYLLDDSGKPIRDIIGYEPPSYEQIAEVVSGLIREIPAVRSVVADIAGVDTVNRPAGQRQNSYYPKTLDRNNSQFEGSYLDPLESIGENQSVNSEVKVGSSGKLQLPRDVYNEIEKIVSSKKDEMSQWNDIALLLKNRGYSQNATQQIMESIYQK